MRVLFIIGVIIAGIFLFFDWYVFQAFDENGNLVVYWSYNPIFSWYTIFASGSVFNELYTPTADSLPLAIIISFLISLAITLVGIAYRTPNRVISHVNIFTLLLVGFFIVVYPIMYLLPYQYYFPSISFFDPYLDITFQYYVHIGYVMEVFSFIFLFPYTFLYYRVATSLGHSSQSVEGMVEKYIQKIQEPVDLDKFIQEEELEIAEQSKAGKKAKLVKTKKSVIKA